MHHKAKVNTCQAAPLQQRGQHSSLGHDRLKGKKRQAHRRKRQPQMDQKAILDGLKGKLITCQGAPSLCCVQCS